MSAVSFSRLDRFLRRAPRLGDVAQDHRVADHLLHDGLRALARRRVEAQRHDVEIQEAMLRIEDLHVAADHLLGLDELVPLEPAQPLAERLAHALLALQPEKLARRAVEIIDAPVRDR